jgi:glycosyltransferase involved in cell wall biosynthesis
LVAFDRLTPAGRARLDLSPGALDSVRGSVLPSRVHAAIWHRLQLPIPAELWSGRVDVLHAPDFLAPPLAAARAVVTVHDLSFLRLPERADPRLQRYLASAVPRSVRRAAHVLADSQNTRQDAIELLGLEPEAVTVAYPGVSPAMSSPVEATSRREVLRRYGLDRPFVLGVGTLEPRKDWPTLIAAFNEAAASLGLDELTLAIAGSEGWMTETIHEAHYSSPADVRLLGFVPDEDLPALYQAATAFAYPSVYEGFGLPPLEAMSCGVPTVVSDSSCLPEVVGDAALIVPAGDAAALASALVKVVSDRETRASLGRRGPQRAAVFTWDACARAAEHAYRCAAE